MKRLKALLVVLSICILQSCVLKSLQPFYTSEAVSFEKSLLGEWKDSKDGAWKIESFKTVFEEENEGAKLSKEDLDAFNKYKETYIISHVKSDKEGLFIGVSFKVDNQLFLDLTPFYFDDDGLNSLLSQHLVQAHSVAKVDVANDDKVSLSFLSESTIEKLIEENKIRLDYEKPGAGDTILLTANSVELSQFLSKYLKSDIKDKWKSQDQMHLNRLDVQP